MLVRLSAAIAAISLLTGAAFAQGTAKPTDPQIAHIAYTAGQLDIEAAKQALKKSKNKEVRAFANGSRPHGGKQAGAGAGQEAQGNAGG
jgi:putative membrane protein